MGNPKGLLIFLFVTNSSIIFNNPHKASKWYNFASPFEKTATPRIVEPASFSIVRAYVIYIIIRCLSDPIPRNRLIRLLRISPTHARRQTT